MEKLNTATGGTDKVLKRLETSFSNAAAKAGLLGNASKTVATTTAEAIKALDSRKVDATAVALGNVGAKLTVNASAANAFAAAMAKVTNVKLNNPMDVSQRGASTVTGRQMSAADVAATAAAYGAAGNKIIAGTTGMATASVNFGAVTTKTNKELAGTIAAADKTHAAFQKAEATTRSAAKGFDVFKNSISPGTRYALYDVSNSMAITGAAMVGLGVAAAATAISWERSFANVARTVGGDTADLQKQFVSLAQTLPVAFADLTDIGSLGGQLGISASGITSFTSVVAKLTATTNLSAEAAGTALGRFKALLGVSEGQFNNLASSILKVGVNSVATETQIVNIATQISSMAAFAGFTADQVVGLSGALASVGAPPELSRGLITRLFANMSDAVANGGDKLNEFARVSGVSSDEFRSKWNTPEFAGTFLKFMNGIAISGGDAVNTLHQLGITSVRDVPLLIRLAGASDSLGRANGLLAQTMSDAGMGWTQNSELAVQYNRIAETTSSRIQVLVGNFQAFLAALGSGATGPIKSMVDGLIALLQTLTNVASNPATSWFLVLGVGLITLVGIVALATAGFARGAAGLIAMKQAMEGLGFATATTSRAMAVLKWATIATGIGAVVVGLGALVATMGTANGMFDTSAEKTDRYFGDLSGLQQAMTDDTAKGGRAVAKFTTVVGAQSEEQKKTAATAKGLAKVMGEVASKTNNAGDSASKTSLKFGQSAAAYVKAQLQMSSGFQNAASDSDFVKYWTTIGANVDDAIEASVQNGEKGVKDYFFRLEQQAAKSKKGIQSFNTGEFFIDGKQFDSALSNGKVNDFAGALGGLKDKAQGAANTMTIMGTATSTTSESLEEAAQKTEELQKSYANAQQTFVSSGSLIKQNQQQQIDAATATADAWKKQETDAERSTDGMAGTWQNYYDGTTLNFDQYLNDLQKQVDAQKNWEGNMTRLAERGLSQEIIDDLTKLGAEGVPLVQSLVDGTDEQLARYKELWGRSGRESALIYAAGLLSVQGVLTTAAQTIGKTAGANTAQKFLDEVAAGRVPFADTLRKYNLDAMGNPIKIPATTDTRQVNDALNVLRTRQSSQGIVIGVTYRNMNTPTVGGIPIRGERLAFARGGYVRGPGTGTNDKVPAMLSNREFVMTAEATKRIGPDRLYAMMRNQKGARGYAKGGLVGGGSGGGSGLGSFSTLDASALQAILALADRPIILYTNDRVIAESTGRGTAEMAHRGDN
jgi:TP901 family phage tail tape measure protein